MQEEGHLEAEWMLGTSATDQNGLPLPIPKRSTDMGLYCGYPRDMGELKGVVTWTGITCNPEVGTEYTACIQPIRSG